MSAALLCAVPVKAPAASASSDSARLEHVVQSYVRAKAFTGAVLVARDGNVVLNRGYGLADVDWQIPVTPQTKFRIASVTKQFTAAAILLLAERGKLRIDDPVSVYWPDAPAAWKNVTLFDLLTHTSGIPNLNTFPDYAATLWKDATPAELVERFSAKPLTFEPGTAYSYGNSDYILLGYLIEKMTGQTYADFLQKNIFDPLQMNDTGVDRNAEPLAKRAQGYVLSPQGVTHAGYVSMTVPFSSGDLYSTTGDLLKWENALFGKRVVNAASLARMTTPVKNGYGFGLFITTDNGHRVVSHSGDIEGFGAMLAYYPDDKLSVIVLSNLFGGATDLIAKNLAKSAFGLPVALSTDRSPLAIAPALQQEYAGSYQLAPGVINRITIDGGRLISQIGNQARLVLNAESQTKFYFTVSDSEVEFFRDPVSHAVTRLVVYQDGAAYEGKKLPP